MLICLILSMHFYALQYTATLPAFVRDSTTLITCDKKVVLSAVTLVYRDGGGDGH
jgi:hypothetical protein